MLNLKQGVFTQPTGRASGHSLGLQSFYYAGPTETRTIQNVFDFTSNLALTDIGLPGLNGLYTDPVVYAKTRVLVFSLTSDSFSFDTDVGWDAQGDALAGQATSRADFRQEAVLDQVLSTDGETINLSFTV